MKKFSNCTGVILAWCNVFCSVSKSLSCLMCHFYKQSCRGISLKTSKAILAVFVTFYLCLFKLRYLLPAQFPSLPALVSFPAFQPWSADSRCKLHCLSGVETSIETLFLSVGIPPGLVGPHSDLTFCTVVLKPGWPGCKRLWHAVVFVTTGDKREIYPAGEGPGLQEEGSLLSFRETTGSC